VAKEFKTPKAQFCSHRFKVRHMVHESRQLIVVDRVGASATSLIIEQQRVAWEQPLEVSSEVVVAVSLKTMNDHYGVGTDAGKSIEEAMTACSNESAFGGRLDGRFSEAARQSEDAQRQRDETAHKAPPTNKRCGLTTWV
jgi:hypothetical protein